MSKLKNKKAEKVEIWDNSKRAKTLILIFWALISLTLAGLISSYFELQILERFLRGEQVSDIEVEGSDIRQEIIAIVQFVLFIISIVVFLNWFRRAYGNLHRLGITYLKDKESMAVWVWFIPIISLFRPMQIMNKIWTATQENIKKMNPSYEIKSGSFIIGLWWALFIISNIIGRILLNDAFENDTIQQLIDGAKIVMLSDMMRIPEALLVILIVSRLSAMETKLAEEVKKSGGTIVYK